MEQEKKKNREESAWIALGVPMKQTVGSNGQIINSQYSLHCT